MTSMAEAIADELAKEVWGNAWVSICHVFGNYLLRAAHVGDAGFRDRIG